MTYRRTPSQHGAWMERTPSMDYPVNVLPIDPDLRTEALRLLVATGLLTEEDARMLRAAATPPHTASDF